MANYQGIKISQLSSIHEIQHEDLLIVADYNNGKCNTRKMDISQLLSTIVTDNIMSSSICDSTTPIGNAVTKAMQQSISASISAVVEKLVQEEIQKALKNNLSGKVLEIISSNYNYVADILDGSPDGSMNLLG